MKKIGLDVTKWWISKQSVGWIVLPPNDTAVYAFTFDTGARALAAFNRGYE